MVEDCHREREGSRAGAVYGAKIDIYWHVMCCDSEIWRSGAMVGDTYSRSGCIVILKYVGVVQW